MEYYFWSVLLCAAGMILSAAVLILAVSALRRRKGRMPALTLGTALLTFAALLRGFGQAAGPYACGRLPETELLIMVGLLLLHVYLLFDLIQTLRGGPVRRQNKK